VTDSRGIPVARLSGRLHPNDLSVQQLLGERAATAARDERRGVKSGTDDLRQCVPDHAYLGGVGSQLPLARIQLSREAAFGRVGPDSQH
jgi:hypothetical protein